MYYYNRSERRLLSDIARKIRSEIVAAGRVEVFDMYPLFGQRFAGAELFSIVELGKVYHDLRKYDRIDERLDAAQQAFAYEWSRLKGAITEPTSDITVSRAVRVALYDAHKKELVSNIRQALTQIIRVRITLRMWGLVKDEPGFYYEPLGWSEIGGALVAPPRVSPGVKSAHY